MGGTGRRWSGRGARCGWANGSSFQATWKRLGITFDLFTRTETDNHREVAQDFFLKLVEKGHITRGTMKAPYCVFESRFLPDRYVEGTCPHCGFDKARGDQCDNCGKPLDPVDLINPRCAFCGRPR